MVSQTPQVWIDFQIFEINNGLNLSWDAVDELFPDGMLDKMFAAFVAMLNELVSVKDWNKYVELLPDLAQERGIDNITEYYGNGQLLHSAFFVNAVKKKNQKTRFSGYKEVYFSIRRYSPVQGLCRLFLFIVFFLFRLRVSRQMDFPHEVKDNIYFLKTLAVYLLRRMDNDFFNKFINDSGR